MWLRLVCRREMGRRTRRRGSDMTGPCWNAGRKAKARLPRQSCECATSEGQYLEHKRRDGLLLILVVGTRSGRSVRSSLYQIRHPDTTDRERRRESNQPRSNQTEESSGLRTAKIGDAGERGSVRK